MADQLKKNETSVGLNKSFKQYRGVWMWDNSQPELFPAFEGRPSDIWVCSFPRSGKVIVFLIYLPKCCMAVKQNTPKFHLSNSCVAVVNFMNMSKIFKLAFLLSGTTLVQEITYLVQTLDFEGAAKIPLDERFPFADVYNEDLPFYKGDEKYGILLPCHLR